MLFKVSMDWMESSFFRAHAYIKSDKFEQAKEWMNDKNQAKWGKRPACFLGSKVAKELLNFTNSGS